MLAIAYVYYVFRRRQVHGAVAGRRIAFISSIIIDLSHSSDHHSFSRFLYSLTPQTSDAYGAQYLSWLVLLPFGICLYAQLQLGG